MPTTEEIKKIASELWRSNDPFISLDKEHPIEYKTEELKEVIKILLRDYCIVPKSKVRENYQSLKNNIPDFKDNPQHHCGFLGGMTELELLFGKSLFEEEK